jgi:hypothetical protein
VSRKSADLFGIEPGERKVAFVPCSRGKAKHRAISSANSNTATFLCQNGQSAKRSMPPRRLSLQSPGARLTLARFNFEWLSDGKDPLK